LTYFAKDYNLKQLSIENDGKEPSAMLLKNIINQIRIDSATVIFIQEEFDKKNAEVIAREIGGTIVPVNPLSYDWSGEMIKIAKALRGL
jgi:ABC-type metal ion transport system, periplasmic component/surface adhesin